VGHELHRDAGYQPSEAYVLKTLGTLLRNRDYPAAATSFQQAGKLFRDFGNRLGKTRTRSMPQRSWRSRLKPNPEFNYD